MQTIRLTDSLAIGPGHPCFIIAEAGVNHNGQLDLAIELVDIAARAGADAVKFQTFKTENLITRDAPKARYHVETTGSDAQQTWFELLKTQELTEEMHVALMRRCREKGILFLSTPYDHDSIELLDRLGVVAYKVASTDANNISLLRRMASKGKPMILSTAMATLEEVEGSVAAIRGQGLSELVVMQCTGDYPSVDSDANLRAMLAMAERFDVIPGYSDHVPGAIAAVAAVALGARAYEKHFTVDRSLPGPDHRASLEPDELAHLVDQIRSAERMLGDGRKRVMPSESQNRNRLRKSIVAATDIAEGHHIDAECIRVVRAGGLGMQAHEYDDVIGCVARHAIPSGTPVERRFLGAR